MRVGRENSFHFNCTVFKEPRYMQVKVFIRLLTIEIVNKENAYN